MAGVKAELTLSIDATLTGTGDLGDPKQRVIINEALSLLAGTDAVNKADILFQDSRNIAASGNEDLDFAGVLTTAFGATIAAAELVAVFIKAHATNVNNVRFGPTASVGALGPFADITDRLSIKPGEYIVLVSESGWAITATTADKWNFANSGSGTGVDYDIVVIARTVAA